MTLKPLESIKKTGVQIKPPSCSFCPYRDVGHGFCHDSKNPERYDILWVFDSPYEEDILHGKPLQSPSGKFWLWKYGSLVGPNGKRPYIGVSHILRCRPQGVNRKWGKLGEYPTGKLRQQSEEHCRLYDDTIRTFNPNLFIINFHPSEGLKTKAFSSIIERQCQKAVDFASQGYRPCVLMGDKVMKLVAPWLRGGVKHWIGHWWLGEWGTRYTIGERDLTLVETEEKEIEKDDEEASV